MACTVGDIARWMDEWAPETTAEPRDNVGLQAGSRQEPVSVILVALDVTPEALAHARRIGAQMMVTHHPLFFRPLNAVTTDTPVGALALEAIRSGVALYAAHTNLDRASGGVNDALCALLGVEGCPPKESAMERIVVLPEPLTLKQLTSRVRGALGASAVRVSGDGGKQIKRLYIIGGSGKSDVESAALAGCDVLLTGELDYHAALTASQLSLATVEAGHDFTEHPVLVEIKTYLQKRAEQVQCSVRTEVFQPASCPFWYVNDD